MTNLMSILNMQCGVIDNIKLCLKMIPVSLLSKRTESSKLQEIYPTFDAQNMPKNDNNIKYLY